MKTPSLTLANLAAFVEVVEAGSLTASARRLDLSKSVVSARIVALEQDLGVSLFHRAASRLVLTPRGEAMYERARDVLAAARRMVEDAPGDEAALRGTLRIAAPVSFAAMYLAQPLAQFMRDHPGLDLVLDLDDRTIDIAGGGYDMAIRIGHMVDSALIGRRICAVRRILCCSPGYAEAHGLPKDVHDLARHACISYGNIQTTAHWSFEAASGGEPVSLHLASRLVANNGEAQREAAIAGLGMLLAPSFLLVDALRGGRLRRVRLDLEPVGLTCFALYPRQRHPPRALRALIDFLAQAIGDPPVWETQLAEVPGYADPSPEIPAKG